MLAKKHIVGFRVDETELDAIQKQVDSEHLSYISALVRKATFWYIEYMKRQAPPGPTETVPPTPKGEDGK
jgi:hypothetical protein